MEFDASEYFRDSQDRNLKPNLSAFRREIDQRALDAFTRATHGGTTATFSFDDLRLSDGYVIVEEFMLWVVVRKINGSRASCAYFPSFLDALAFLSLKVLRAAK